MTTRENANFVMEKLENAGFKAFLVGGAVRNLLLGLNPHDLDLATSANPTQVATLFPNSKFVGENFGVSLVNIEDDQFEVATFRLDAAFTATSDGRHPDEVKFTTSAEEDCQRRDFTCNALFMDRHGKVFDFVDGVADINNKVLRCVGNPLDRFREDSLRMLRAVRFCACLDFTMDKETKVAVVALAHTVKNLPAERVASELSRMLTSGHADVAFDLLLETGLAAVVIPELCDFVGCEHNSNFHPEEDVANHVRLLLAGLEKGCSLTLALSVLLHDVAKPKTRRLNKDGKTQFLGHETVGAAMAEDILHRLKFSNDVIKTVVSHVRNHMKFFCTRQMKRSTLMRFLRTDNFQELLALGKLDVAASNKDFSDVDFVERFLKENADELKADRLVNGDDLVAMGFVPGPNFKVLLEQVETAQFEGKFTTREGALNFLRNKAPRKMKG